MYKGGFEIKKEKHIKISFYFSHLFIKLLNIKVMYRFGKLKMQLFSVDNL